MSLNFVPMYSLLLIFISITISIVSSRPITTDPAHVHTSTPSPKIFVLITSGGEKFQVQLNIAQQSETIRQMILERGFSDEMILSFPNITGEIMSKVLEYCNKHVYYDGAGNNITAVAEMRAFDRQFVDVHYETLFKLVLAANDLKIKKLLDLVSGRLGDMIKGKSPQDIRNLFNINENSCADHHPTQKELNIWAFQ